jgi:DNA-binding MarR family transcriptional regulator
MIKSPTREENINSIVYSFINFRKGLVKDSRANGCGLPHAQTEVLFCIYHNSDIGTSDLAKYLNITPSAATQLVDILVNSGIIDRIPDNLDRRVTRLRLTAKGEGMMEQIKEDKLKKVSELLAPLTEGEVANFANILNKISESIQNQGGK